MQLAFFTFYIRTRLIIWLVASGELEKLFNATTRKAFSLVRLRFDYIATCEIKKMRATASEACELWGQTANDVLINIQLFPRVCGRRRKTSAVLLLCMKKFGLHRRKKLEGEKGEKRNERKVSKFSNHTFAFVVAFCSLSLAMLCRQPNKY